MTHRTKYPELEQSPTKAMRASSPLLIVTGILCVLAVNAQRSCEKGTVRDADGICSKCPMGTTQPFRNAVSCKPCPPGTFSSIIGSIFPECRECPPGTFSLPGAANCTPCPPGMESGIGYSKCIKCGPGLRVRFSGFKPRCEKCAKNTFSTGQSNRVCNPCPPGAVALDQGAKRCTKCPKGTFFSQLKSQFGIEKRGCRPCAKGTFNDELGATYCKICRPGTFSDIGAEMCTPCPAGKFAGQIASSSCQDCPSGTTSLGIRPAACKHATRGCTFNTFENPDGECEACMPGEKLDVSMKKCVSCGENQISEGGVSTKCTTCPPDRVPAKGIALRDGSECMCRLGTQDRISGPSSGPCEPCPRGTFGGFPDEDRMNGRPGAQFGNVEITCEFCPQAISKPGAKSVSACKECPDGSIETNLNTCSKCPRGFTSFPDWARDDDGNLLRLGAFVCVSEKTGCNLGDVLRNGRCTRDVCPKDSFRRKRFCISCLPGEFANVVKGKCFDCPPKKTSRGGAVTKCTKCPRGLARSFDLNAACVCDEGSESTTNNPVADGCTKCKPGTFARKPGGKCLPCPPREFARRQGAAYCELCPENSVTIAAGATKCVECPKGSKLGRDLLGREKNRCVPVDPYNNDPDFLDNLPGF